MIGTDCTGSCKSNYLPYDHGHDGPLSKFVYTCLVWNLSNNIQNSMLFQYTMYLYITMLQEKEKKRTCYWTITYYPYDALK